MVIQPSSSGSAVALRVEVMPRSPMSPSERSQLQGCEHAIDRAIRAVSEAGGALEVIRSRRLYRETHATFEAYCRERWGFTRSRASRLINGAEIVSMLPMGNTVECPPERQLRELLPLRSDEVAVIEAWRDAQRIADEMNVRLSPQLVRNAVQKRLARISREQAIDAPHTHALPGHIRIEHCDIDDLRVDPASIRLIVADPPYAATDLGLYSRLATFAAQALMPGGVLVAYTGCLTQLEAANRLAESLTFVATGAVILDGASTDLHSVRLRAGVKPLIFFSRGEIRVDKQWTNTIRTKRADRILHPWQQAEEHARVLIEQFTAPGDMVCDPFLGSGTTAVTADLMGRGFTGCDLDPDAVRITTDRLLHARGLETPNATT